MATAPTASEALNIEQSTVECSKPQEVIVPRRSRQTFTDLRLPGRLAITREGHLLVGEFGEQKLVVIDPANGRKMKSWVNNHTAENSHEESPNRICAVAVTQDDQIVVAYEHCLQVLTAEGALIATVGSEGSQPLQFDGPWGIAIDHNGKLYITDAGNNRVQVLNADLTFSHCFGSKGAQPGEFKRPSGITIDADGMVYVSDNLNHRVQKFTPEGKLLAVIDSKGEGGDRLNDPYGLCVDSYGILYVAEYRNYTVSMFTSEGRFLGYVGDSGRSSFTLPRYVIFDQTGRLCIADIHGVHIYN